jgi:hypothetical protein
MLFFIAKYADYFRLAGAAEQSFSAGSAVPPTQGHVPRAISEPNWSMSALSSQILGGYYLPDFQELSPTVA